MGGSEKWEVRSGKGLLGEGGGAGSEGAKEVAVEGGEEGWWRLSVCRGTRIGLCCR